MMSKFPISMESLPMQKKSFACFSLRLGSVLAALTIILYSAFAIVQCVAALEELPSRLDGSSSNSMALYGLAITVTITHSVTLLLSTLMLVGVLCKKVYLIRPWTIWESIQLTMLTLMFIFCSAINITTRSGGQTSLMIYVIEFLAILLRFYMLVIVCSYYKQLEKKRGQSEQLNKLMSTEYWTFA